MTTREKEKKNPDRTWEERREMSKRRERERRASARVDKMQEPRKN